MAIVNHDGDTLGTPKQAAAKEIFRLIQDNEHMDHYVASNEMTDNQKAKYIEQYNLYLERIKKILKVDEK